MIQQFIRKHLLNLKPYSSARDEYKGSEGVFLDANENSFGSSSGIDYNRYPDPHQKALKNQLGLLKNVSSDNIFIGNGSDEPIDLLIRLCCEPKEDNIIICPPTYGMYAVSANINNVSIKEVLLTEETFQIQPKIILQQVDEHTKLIFICSPNNPTGNIIKPELIQEVIDNFKGLIVIDEAYIDFASSTSWINKLANHANLVVLQTFSKAWGLANLRVGALFAHQELVQYLDTIKPPYNVNGYSQSIALEALQNDELKQTYLKDILHEKQILKDNLLKLKAIQKVYDSDANFFLIKVDNAAKYYDALVQKNIIVRNRSNQPLCEDTLRVTIGTPTENEALINAIAAV